MHKNYHDYELVWSGRKTAIQNGFSCIYYKNHFQCEHTNGSNSICIDEEKSDFVQKHNYYSLHFFLGSTGYLIKIVIQALSTGYDCTQIMRWIKMKESRRVNCNTGYIWRIKAADLGYGLETQRQ